MMDHKMKNMRTKSKRGGLILLIVLGMLALFSLLAITYVVSAGASKAGSVAMRVKALNSNVTIQGASQSVMNGLIRGTNDQTSSFYMHNLLGDIYSPNPLRTTFGHALPALDGSGSPVPFQADWCRLMTSPAGPNLVKVSLVNSNVVNGPLSDFENDYNSRVLTILEGPLAGQSFRIIKYVGYVRGPSNNAPIPRSDSNIQVRSELTVPWAAPGYVDPENYKIDYSVLIDLNDVKGTNFTGQFYNGAGVVETINLPLSGWISRFGITSLFFLSNSAANSYQGYSLLINDTAFNNAGIGLNDVAEKIRTGPVRVPNPGFGTLDGRELMAIPSMRQQIPPSLLPHYDYLQRADMMTTTLAGIGVQTRTGLNQNILSGASNEGFDVADWHDFWLSHNSFVNGQANIIPAFHRPELVNYIANLFGNPKSMLPAEVAELLKLIDASSARILSYRFDTAVANPNFGSNDPLFPRLVDPSWTSPTPTTGEILALQNYVALMINGPWDIDNDRDGIPDSVWTNPGLPITYSTDGRMLRPLAAILVEDLDSRININTSGDRSQGLAGFNIGTMNAFQKTAAGTTGVRQGFGVGPAEISLTSLFNYTPSLLSTGVPNPPTFFPFSFFDDRYGARRYKLRPLSLTDASLDRVPGRRFLNNFFTGNDNFSQQFEREFHNPRLPYVVNSHGTMPGAPLSRRSNIGSVIDRNGNLAFVQQVDLDANPYNPTFANATSETDDDPYEMAALEVNNSDDPFGLNDLQTICLRFEGDSFFLSRRLRERLEQIPGYGNTSDINRLITTRSAELRYPNLVSAMKTQSTFSTTELSINSQATSLQRWIQMVHAQRYQTRTLPRPAIKPAADDPELTIRAIEELFPSEFAKGLRMDLNRPFGNGIDDDNDGQIDEPQELTGQLEVGFDATGGLISSTGDYHKGIQQTLGLGSDGTRQRLGSRQIMARNLYCIAQLIIPRDYVFPGMTAAGLTELQVAKIRGTAIAQWAVNVVDFRDADVAMTRFEFDYLPFGTGTGTSGGMTERPAYWAPDHLNASVNSVMNKDYVGVVWGMEMPELLLTESLGLHDKRQRDTDLDTAGDLYDTPAGAGDRNYDQYRFPLASLFLELYCPRTTDLPYISPTGPNSNVPANVLLPGVPGRRDSLYTLNGSNQVALDLGKRAPASGSWGSQPVWRIAISEYDTVNMGADRHPNNLVTDLSKTANLTHQTSSVANIDGVPWPPASAPDQVTGSGLRYDLRYPDSFPPVAVPPVAFDRFVWFSNVGPTSTQDIPDLKASLSTAQRQTVYYARGTQQTMTGGSYLVVGPRINTELGSSTNSRTTPFPAWIPILKRADVATTQPIFSPSSQRISFSGNTVSTRMMNNVEANFDWVSRVKTPVSLVCAADPPRDSATTINPIWDAAFPDGVGLNISFPNPYFDSTNNKLWDVASAPTRQLNSGDAGGFAGMPPDSWINTNSGTVVGNLPGDPYDDRNSSGVTLNSEIQKLPETSPLGTYENVRAAYLQRLADPEFAYDPINNPYITVDWISLDLTVFNGEAPVNPAINRTPLPHPIRLQSRYKDGRFASGPNTSETGDSSTSGFSYHSPNTRKLEDSISQAAPPLLQHRSYFSHQLGFRTPITWGSEGSCGTTLGYINAGFAPVTPGTPPTPGPPLTSLQMATQDGSLTYLLDGFGPPVTNSVSNAVLGAPRNIASLAWFNRPFASPHELMLVPFTGPGQFGYYHSKFTGTARKAFSFLPSFHSMNPSNVDEPPATNPARSYWLTPGASVAESDLQLLFEIVETAPPFADAHKAIRPDGIGTLITNAGSSTPIDYVALRFLNSYVKPDYYAPTTFDMFRGPGLSAPSNLIPTYVTAGKVNLNTITELNSGTPGTPGNVPALKAIQNNVLDIAADRGTFASPTFGAPNQTQFMASRRGFLPPTATDSVFFADPTNPMSTGGRANPVMNSHFPTQFAGAFRPASSANIAPFVPDAPDGEARARLRGKFGVETTLARSLNPLAYSAFTATDINAQAPLFADPSASNVATQNAFVRHQQEMRLPNLISNQSNVFAVWITVSLYEYDPITGFGNEFLDEAGEPKRERSFYIIDRSIPVGYKPGENLNTDRTILVHRKLN